MSIIDERKAPFEIIKIYSQKVLADKSKAALRRTIRNQKIADKDKATFKKLY
jgi:hypothetical protein